MIVAAPPSRNPDHPLPVVRQSVRDLLLATPAYQELSPEKRRQMAELMVKVCDTAANLLLEEVESDASYKANSPEHQRGTAALTTPLATAQAAGDELSGVSAQRVAGTTRAILNAVSFPRFVTELINGVFKAITDSNMQQLHQYIELLNNVAATTEGFAEVNMAPARARAWLVERFPESFEISGGDDDFSTSDVGFTSEPEFQDSLLQLRPNATMPSPEALRTAFGLEPNEPVPTGDPERGLVPLARRYLARSRQEMLATLVQMGMQRIIVESGRINAAMRFHIDTRSAAQSDQGSRFDFAHTNKVGGRFGAGPWGANASMQNTVGYITTQQTHTTEELNTDLELTSAVEINFKSDYVPLNRLASAGQAKRIQANSRNPNFEATRKMERERQQRNIQQDQKRRSTMRQELTSSKKISPSTVEKPQSTKTKPSSTVKKPQLTTKKPQPTTAKKPSSTPKKPQPTAKK